MIVYLGFDPSSTGKQMADFCHSILSGTPGAPPVVKRHRQMKSQKTGILLGSLGVSDLTSSRAAGPVRNLSTGYPQINVDNLIGVWEF